MEKRKRIAALILILVFSTGAYWFWQNYFSAQGGEIQVSGTIEATTVDLNAKIAGTIQTLTVKAGDSVEEGQLVAELSRNDLVAQWERDQLSVAKAEAGLADLMSGTRAQEISEGEANLNIARANLKMAEDELARLEALLEVGAVTQVSYDNAKINLEIAQNKVQAAEARLILLKAGYREELIKQAEVEVQRNKAVLKATEAMLEDLKIYSPLKGVVLSKNYELGECVQPGASIATVVNLDDLWIKVYIPTDDLPLIKLGQKVTFTVSGFDRVFEGVVEEIATKGEFTPKTIQTKKERTNVVFAVKIRINNEDGILKPGMPADVVFPGGSTND
ncbi:MAG: HlyD family efflux transporter periplasmic adaptor subunit [Clostridia bacterium]|nr:HlyD family efflux transporter periplasmic adaptor subunit [Clostridia bacterium]